MRTIVHTYCKAPNPLNGEIVLGLQLFNPPPPQVQPEVNSSGSGWRKNVLEFAPLATCKNLKNLNGSTPRKGSPGARFVRYFLLTVFRDPPREKQNPGWKVFLSPRVSYPRLWTWVVEISLGSCFMTKTWIVNTQPGSFCCLAAQHVLPL